MKIKIILGFCFVSLLQLHVVNAQSPNDLLTLKNMNHGLLNQLVMQEVNAIRQAKGVDALDSNKVLHDLSVQYHSTFEFRRFNKPTSIERRIKRAVHDDARKKGFTGGIVVPVCGQYYALDYDGKSDFFYNKADEKTELKMYYGPKSKSKRKDVEVKPIPHHTYQSFAKAIVKNLNSENKKQLFKEAYKWGEVHLQWHYKSLYRNHKIPKIKAIFILSGYETALIRD